jgi:uncharacterized RDD family membrane protein YckC
MRQRTGAIAIDFAILLATAGVLSWVLLRVLDHPGVAGSGRGLDRFLQLLELTVAEVALLIAPFFAMAGLYVLVFSFLKGRTVGQQVMHIRTVDVTGRPPSLATVAIRLVAQFIGLLPGALGWWWAWVDTDRRTVHDHIARTYVVRDA